jgi:hypothetical protein
VRYLLDRGQPGRHGRDYQTAGLPRMPRSVTNRYPPAEGDTEHDGPGQAQRIDDRGEIIGPRVQGPLGRRAQVTSTVPSLIWDDHVGDIGQVPEHQSHTRTIDARTTVQAD